MSSCCCCCCCCCCCSNLINRNFRHSKMARDPGRTDLRIDGLTEEKYKTVLFSSFQRGFSSSGLAGSEGKQNDFFSICALTFSVDRPVGWSVGRERVIRSSQTKQESIFLLTFTAPSVATSGGAYLEWLT